MNNFILKNDQSRVIIEEKNDLIFTYIVPIMGTVGFILQLLSFLVFSNSKFKELLYQYLKLESFCLLLNCFNASFKPIFHCRTCKISKTYYAQLYFIIFIEFGSSLLEFSAIVNRILSSFCCFMLLCNKMSKQKPYLFFYYSKLVNLAIFFFGSTIFSFKIFSYEIVKKSVTEINSNQTKSQYEFRGSNFSKGAWKNALEISAFVFRDAFNIIILLVLNFLIYSRIKNNLSKKKTLFMPNNTNVKLSTHQNESFKMDLSFFNDFNKQNSKNKKISTLARIKRCEIKHSIIVLISCFNYLVGRIPIMVFFILRNLNKENHYLLKGSVLTVYFSYNFNFFLYYFSNKQFRRVFKKICNYYSY